MAPDMQKIQEMQILEQSFQNMILQKQAFQSELSETESALKEVESSEGDVFKLIGQLLIKTEKSKIKADLENKQKLLKLRVQTLEKQENSIREKLEELQESATKSKNK